MNKYETKLILAFFLLLPIFVNATNITIDVSGEIDQNQNKILYLNEDAELTISVSQGGRNTSSPEVAGLENFKVGGRRTSTNISMINGALSSENTYGYEIYPTREGNFEIGPARVTHDGQTVESNKVKVIVKQRQANNSQKSQAQNTHQQKQVESLSSQNSSSSAEVIGKIVLNKKQAFVGEPIIAKLLVYARGPVIQLSLNPPNFPNFLSKEVKIEKKGVQVLNQKEYHVIEKQYVLTPIQPGEKEIASVEIIYEAQVPLKSRRRANFFGDDFFDSFFQPQAQVQQFKVKSDKVKIQINSLPQLEKSVNGVGQFSSITASADKNEASANEPILLSLEIHGKGNLEQIATPKLNLPNSFKYYESKSSVTENLDESYKGGSKKFEFVLQAMNPGEWQIPPQNFSYFDVETKSVKTLTTLPISLKINQAEQSPNMPNQQTVNPIPVQQEEPPIIDQNKETTTKDIRFIEDDAKIYQGNQTSIPLPIFIFLLLIMLLIYKKHILKKHLTIITNKYQIKKSKNKNMDKFLKEFEKIQQDKNTQNLHQLFINIIATKCGILNENINDEIIEKFMSNLELDHNKTIEFMDFLNSCASRRFTSLNHDIQEYNENELLKKANYWLLFLTK